MVLFHQRTMRNTLSMKTNMVNIDVNWNKDIPVVKQVLRDKNICTITEHDGLWLTKVSSDVTYSKMKAITNYCNSGTIDNAARCRYVAYLFETLDNEYHEPCYVLATLKELENELAMYATQPLQKLADCQKGWTKYLDGAVLAQKALRKRKSDILDEITEQNNKEKTK